MELKDIFMDNLLYLKYVVDILLGVYLIMIILNSDKIIDKVLRILGYLRIRIDIYDGNRISKTYLTLILGGVVIVGSLLLIYSVIIFIISFELYYYVFLLNLIYIRLYLKRYRESINYIINKHPEVMRDVFDKIVVENNLLNTKSTITKQLIYEEFLKMSSTSNSDTNVVFSALYFKFEEKKLIKHDVFHLVLNLQYSNNTVYCDLSYSDSCYTPYIRQYQREVK